MTRRVVGWALGCLMAAVLLAGLLQYAARDRNESPYGHAHHRPESTARSDARDRDVSWELARGPIAVGLTFGGVFVIGWVVSRRRHRNSK